MPKNINPGHQNDKRNVLENSEAWHSRDPYVDDSTDLESYEYEYKTQSYVRKPRTSENESGQSKIKPRPSKDFMIVNQMKPEKRNTRNTSRTLEDIRDIVYLNQAATKIQAAYRGFRTRKMFWKEREFDRQQKRKSSAHMKQEEYVIPSVTSIVDYNTFPAITKNMDPNVGLTAALPVLDSSQKGHILREIKSKLKFSDEISTINQLQDESTPMVLLIGGINPVNAKDYLLGACMFVYNVQKDRWYFGGTMIEPRNYHGVAYLDGRVYVIGGYSPLQISNHQMLATQTTYQLNVRSKRWRKREDMHFNRACHGTCVVNDYVMVIGGRDAEGNLLSSVETYDPTRDSWSVGKPLPEPLMGMGCAFLDDSVWVLGGIAEEGGSNRYGVSNRVYAFDTKNQNWHRKQAMPEPRAFCTAVTLKHQMWVWGGIKEALGEDGFLLSSNTTFVLNAETTKWEIHNTLGTPKHGMTVAKLGRRIFLLGGISSVRGAKEVLNENDCFNRENDRLSEGAPLPRPLTGAAAVNLSIDYIATSDLKWDEDNEGSKEEAAIKIQAAFRGYKTRSSLGGTTFPVSSSHTETKSRRPYLHASQPSKGDAYDDKWKLFANVKIADWPPVPSIMSSSSHLNIALGTQPAGYTLTTVSTGVRIRRYISLPSHADPNLGLTGYLCNIYKKTKKILGLRRVEHLPTFAASMRTVASLQDDSIPVVLVIGGLQPRDPSFLCNGKLLLRYHTLKDRWEFFGILPQPRNYHAAVYYQENVYVTGGCDPDLRNGGEMVATNTCYCLNIHSNEWVLKTEMLCTRSHHSLVAADGRLYAVGGRDYNGRLVASIEAYEISINKWILLRPMNSPRMGMACCIFEDQIWCLGGVGAPDKNSLTFPILTSVVSYDIAEDKWISRPPLRCPRAYGTCVVVEKCLWLLGGASKDRNHDYLISMGSVDRYHQSEARWVRTTLLNNPRHAAAILAIDTCVYVFGGICSQEWSALDRNEMLILDDISLHTCCSLPTPLAGLAAVTIPPVVPSLRSASFALLLHSSLS